MLSVIVIKSHLVNVFNNNRPNSKQTLILPVHIKSQLSYAAITEKFCIRKLYNLWKNSKKVRLKKSTRKMRIVSRSWQNCLEGPQNCPQGRGFCLFFCPGAGISYIFSPGGGGMLVLGIDWCISTKHHQCFIKFSLITSFSCRYHPTKWRSLITWLGSNIWDVFCLANSLQWNISFQNNGFKRKTTKETIAAHLWCTVSTSRRKSRCRYCTVRTQVVTMKQLCYTHVLFALGNGSADWELSIT